jgi:hypothetical protein
LTNDTLRARSFVREFGLQSLSSSAARPIFPGVVPVTWEFDTPCPFPNARRCKVGPKKSFTVTSGLVNSQQHLGINAPVSDRIDVKLTTTCSPLVIDDLAETVQRDGMSLVRINMGPNPSLKANFTWDSPVEIPLSTATYSIGYV